MEKPILLIPGASATGRDYLLDKILEEQALREVCRRLGRDNLNVKIVVKTTDRPGRPGVVEVTKKCISPEEFDQGLASGDIFAHYVLESNGSRYGYTANAFDVADADLLVADASIYQVAQLKERFSGRVHAAAVIADRAFRKHNLLLRGSENPEEVEKRLNVGDIHVALAVMMSGSGIDYRQFIDQRLAELISRLAELARQEQAVESIEQEIETIIGSKNVCQLIKDLALRPKTVADDLVVRRQEELVDDDQPFIDSALFEQGVKMIQSALNITDSVSSKEAVA